MSDRRVRVLIAKPGLDGHDVGAKIVCRALRDAGMEVIYTGLRQSPEAIARAAIDEDVDVVGLSILSGAHLPLGQKVAQAMKDAGARPNLLWLVGGNIPRSDIQPLNEIGVAGVFGIQSDFSEIVSFIEQEVTW